MTDGHKIFDIEYRPTKQFLLERDIFRGRVLLLLLIYCAMTMCTCSDKYVTAPARKTVVILPSHAHLFRYQYASK